MLMCTCNRCKICILVISANLSVQILGFVPMHSDIGEYDLEILFSFFSFSWFQAVTSFPVDWSLKDISKFVYAESYEVTTSGV